MAKRTLRVTKWLGMIPAMAVCTACGREFRAPLTSLKRLTEAQESLQLQFDRHKCTSEKDTVQAMVWHIPRAA